MYNKLDKVAITYPYLCNFRRNFDGNQCKELGLDIRIKTNPSKPKLEKTVVTISSKILRHRCTELISQHTIHDVYQVVKEWLDMTFEEFMLGKTRSQIEVTEDIRVANPSYTIGNLHKLSGLQLVYHSKRKTYRSKGQHTSFYLKKDSLTPKFVDYLSCYDKEKQMLRLDNRENQRLLGLLTIEQRERVMQYYGGKVRLEVKLHSVEKIRQHFGLPIDYIPTLRDILHSKIPVVSNMISSIFSRVVEDRQHEFSCKTERELLYLTVLRQYDFDLQRSFNHLSSYVHYTVPSRPKKILRQLIERHRHDQIDTLVAAYQEVMEELVWETDNHIPCFPQYSINKFQSLHFNPYFNIYRDRSPMYLIQP